jgi:hypothetical protein
MAPDSEVEDGNRRARRMWQLLEPLHAVTYFAPEARDAYRDAGLKGFWMGYFAGRAAPMGAVGPATVTATFFNFAPPGPARALPDAWALAPPERVLEARLLGAEGALGRILDTEHRPEIDAALRSAAGLARHATEGAGCAGRPLAAANLGLDWPPDPLLVLWQAATILREHRGDGHVAALVTAGLDGCEAHVSFVATGAVTRDVLQPSRGWTDEEWEQAEHRLVERGWLEDDLTLSPVGVAGRRAIEETTDRLATGPWQRLGPAQTAELARVLEPLSAAVVSSGTIPFTNPIGVPLG